MIYKQHYNYTILFPSLKAQCSYLKNVIYLSFGVVETFGNLLLLYVKYQVRVLFFGYPKSVRFLIYLRRTQNRSNR